MRRDKVIEIITARRSELSDRFGVKSLALFGSVARDENRAYVPAWRKRPSMSRDVLLYLEDMSGSSPVLGSADAALSSTRL